MIGRYVNKFKEFQRILESRDEFQIHKTRKLIAQGLLPAGDAYDELPKYRKYLAWMRNDTSKVDEYLKNGEYQKAYEYLEDMEAMVKSLMNSVAVAMEEESHENQSQEEDEESNQ